MNIRVSLIDENALQFEFKVHLKEGERETEHSVCMRRSDYMVWTQGEIPAVDWVKASFDFLLERENMESILSRFEITVIEQYFPEYERAMMRRFRPSV